MKIIAEAPSGERFDLGSPVKLILCSSFDTPADSFYASFAISEPLPEFAQIEVCHLSQKVFEGTVDEQEQLCGKSGLFLNISARAFSQLLDNEAPPATYHRCALSDIYNLHLKPYGIKGVLGEGRCEGDFSVAKGSCEWSVVEEFCKSVLDVQPSITRDGYLDALKDRQDETPIKIGNFAGADYSYETAAVKYKRYGVIGEIVYKTDASQPYSRKITDDTAVGKGITTRRFVNLSGISKWARQYKLEQTFLESAKGSMEIEIKIPFDFFEQVGTPVCFTDAYLGTFENMRIFEITHSLSNQEKACTVVLRPSAHVR